MRERPGTEREEEEQAAREAGRIGGASVEPDDPAHRPVREGGGGEAEGFEQAEELLEKHASHGDLRPAHAALHDEIEDAEADTRRADGEPDHERTSESDERD